MLIACAGGDNMALTGVDAATGKPICMKQPVQTDLCADGTMAKSIRHYTDADGNRRLALQCGSPTKEIECPANYFLQQVNTTTLDGASRETEAMCVYAGMHEASRAVPTPSKRIFGRFCPQGYKSKSRCVIDESSIVSSPGTCPWCWGSALNCASSTVAESPVGSGRFQRSTDYFCSDTTPKIVQPNRGRAEMVSENNPMGYVDCRLQHAQQDCGATWDALVRLEVVCEIDGDGPNSTLKEHVAPKVTNGQ
ncbi:MAG: hypothetical protein EOP06_27325 [Proteobacteria bacterium]|nr:MAG: hypothetical protein EOP06_27325 [Pseudomonadota bacterium]